jgi:hypothetical protein
VSEELRVERAAIRRDADGKVWSVPAPGRHHTVMGVMAQEFGWKIGDPPVDRGCTQGFLLSNGRFATRKAAAIIAQRAKQLLERAPTGGSFAHGLFSEDVW